MAEKGKVSATASRMGTRHLLTEAAKTLGVAEKLRLVEPHRYRAVLERIIETRTQLSKDAVSALWWWEALREPVAYCKPEDVLRQLLHLAPPDELLWLVVEANEVPSKREGNFWLYEARIDVIAKVLREIPFCEYYVVGRKCDWLLCENHHDMLVASGSFMTEKLLGMTHLKAQLTTGRG